MFSRKLFFIICLTIAIAACSKESSIPTTKTEPRPDLGELVVVSTNDFHAALDRAEGLASAIAELKSKYGSRMIYLDAGDQFQGSIEGNISKGKAVVGFFNLLGLDAAAIGNHEFDYGPDVPDRITVLKDEDGLGTLKKRIGEATYPYLSANFVIDPPVTCDPGPRCNALRKKTVFEPRTIIERDEIRIGIIGGTTTLTRNITSPAFLLGTTFDELMPVVREEAKFLRETAKCDWVLFVVHSGLRYQPDGKTLKPGELLSLAKSLPSDSIDAIVGGHSHEPAMEVVNGIPIMQTGSLGSQLGVLHLKRVEGRNQSRFDPFVQVPDTGVLFRVTDFMKPYRRMALEKKREVIGKTSAAFVTDRTRETAVGNLVADAVLEAGKRLSGADVSLINGGALRNRLPAGTITYSQLFKLLPYDDNLVVAELTGEELRTLLEISSSGTLGIPLIAGLRITRMKSLPENSALRERDLNKDGMKDEWERNLLIDVLDQRSKPIDPKKIYKVATLSYLVEGGDYHEFIYEKVPASRIHFHSEILVREIISDYIKKNSPLNPARFYLPDQPRIRHR